MTRVTISGDGSYNVYVKVNRRSSSRKSPNKLIAVQPKMIRRQRPQPSRDDLKRKPVIEQLMMDL